MATHYNKLTAVAYMKSGTGIRGTVRFFQRTGGTLVIAQISGLPQNSESGFFAFHIHEGGDCSGSGFSEARGHFNPQGKNHPNHAGDLPPLLSVGGKAHMSVLTGRFRADEVIGKTVVIHSRADDFHSQPAGNPGEKLACGVIEKVRW